MAAFLAFDLLLPSQGRRTRGKQFRIQVPQVPKTENNLLAHLLIKLGQYRRIT